jgi:hypothetical protein
MFYYDQSGANACGAAPCDGDNIINFTAPWSANVQNGLPCSTNLAGATGTMLRYGNGNFTQAAPLTAGGVAIRFTAAGAVAARMIVGTSGTPSFGWRASLATVGSTGGTLTASATDNAWHSFIYTLASVAANSTIVVDGSTTTGTATTTGFSAMTIEEFSDQGGTAAVSAATCESYVLNSAPASFTALQANIKAFWGTP